MTGFSNPLADIPSRDPNKPFLVRRLFPGPNGSVVKFVDPATGQVVENPQGYNIWEPQIADIESLGLTPTHNQNEAPKTPETPAPNNQYQNPTHVPEPGISDGNTNNPTPGNYHRDQSNNFGYIDKPGFMGLASHLPGVLGIAGKGINAAINANNVGAVNAARDVMDVDSLSPRETLGGVAKDRQGFVGNVDITNQAGKTNQYAVGLEAMTPSGKTTLTPDEARMRAFANPNNISLSKEQKEEKKGLGSTIRSFLTDLFSDDEVETTKIGGHTVAKEKSGGVYDKFPDAPAAPKDNKGFSGNRGEGLSDAARDAVDKGPGGLY